jgi:predicted nucleic acid-binding protein
LVIRRIAVFDASSLIALTQIDRLWLLPRLFDTVLVPPAVAQETASTVGNPNWFVPHTPLSPIDVRLLEASLDPGETEAIAVALDLNAEVVLDDLSARRLALELGLPVVGVVGIILRAKRHGLVASVRPDLEALRRHAFFLSDQLLQQALSDADEND